MKYDNLINRQFYPTFASNIHHYEVRGYDKSHKMILTRVITKDGTMFDDEIEEQYFIGAFETGDYKWSYPRLDDAKIFTITNPYYQPEVKSPDSINNGPCCNRCMNRTRSSEFCDKHKTDDKCYRFKFDKNS
jgi:hypothetical protein